MFGGRSHNRESIQLREILLVPWLRSNVTAGVIRYNAGESSPSEDATKRQTTYNWFVFNILPANPADPADHCSSVIFDL
jgi:hypothetical protein